MTGELHYKALFQMALLQHVLGMGKYHIYHLNSLEGVGMQLFSSWGAYYPEANTEGSGTKNTNLFNLVSHANLLCCYPLKCHPVQSLPVFAFL